MVHFARLLYATFDRFGGGNPDVTISAGVALAKPGVPMRVIKDLAEEELEASKGRSEEQRAKAPVKNAVTLFGVTCPWKEFGIRLSLGEWLEKLCLDGTLSQGFVRRLLEYSRKARAFAAGDISCGLYRSHMVYDISRNFAQKKGFPPDVLRQLQSLSYAKDFENMEISVTWALYRTRASI